MPDNTCVSCGRIIPEGRQVCLHCSRGKDMQDFGGLPRTNGDRIRGMSNHELAEFLYEKQCYIIAHFITHFEVYSVNHIHYWLESEV